MRLVMWRLAIDEETDGNEASTKDHQRDTELRAADIVVAHLEFAVDTIIDWGIDLRSKEEADTEGGVVQSSYADAFVVRSLPEGREG
jgi:hypothetical protein